jgi:hypothetical protein
MPRNANQNRRASQNEVNVEVVAEEKVDMTAVHQCLTVIGERFKKGDNIDDHFEVG